MMIVIFLKDFKMRKQNVLNGSYQRSGYFYTVKNDDGSKGSAFKGWSKDKPTSTLTKYWEQYKKDPCNIKSSTGIVAGFGVDLINNGTVSNLCVDVDAHDGSSKEEFLIKFTTALTENDITFGVEQNENSKGYHIWISGEEIGVAEAKGLLMKINDTGNEIFPKIDAKSGLSSSAFIRLPGLYKDGIGRSFYIVDGTQIFLTTAKEVEKFFDNCYNHQKGLLQILDVIYSFFEKNKVVKVSARKRQASVKDGNKHVAVNEDELNRLLTFVEDYEEIFVEGQQNHFNFNSNVAVDLLSQDEAKLKLITKEEDLVDNILAGLDRVDRSNDTPNSFIVVDKYENCKKIKSIGFYRNRDNKGVVFFDASRSWSVDDLIKRLPDIPIVEAVYKHVKLEKISTPIEKNPFSYRYRVTYDFKNDKELDTVKIYELYQEFTLAREITGYIEQKMGSLIKCKFSTDEIQVVAKLKSIYSVNHSYYAGGFVDEFKRIIDGEYTEKELSESFDFVMSIINVDESKVSVEIVRKFMEVILQKAAMKMYNCLPTENDLQLAIDNPIILDAIANRINVSLTNSLVFVGDSGSGKTTLLRNISIGISNVMKFGTKNKLHPTKSSSYNEFASNSTLQMDTLATLSSNLCSLFTEYKPNRADIETTQAAMVGFLTSSDNKYRFAHEKHIVCQKNMCCFLGFDTDSSSIFSFKEGNKRRFLPVSLKKLDSDTAVSDAQLDKFVNTITYIVEYYINDLMVNRNNKAYFTTDYEFSAEIKDYIEKSLTSVTQTRGSISEDMLQMLCQTSKENKEKYPVLSRRLCTQSSPRNSATYKNSNYIYISGKSISSIIDEFSRWYNNSSCVVKEDSIEVSELKKRFKELNIKNESYKLPTGKSERLYKVLFVKAEVDDVEPILEN